jgi:hypothetical protein
MPKISTFYCKTTPISKMGFSQIASCKAQGIISRSSRENKGKYVKSPKYRTSINRKKTSRRKGKTSRKK